MTVYGPLRRLLPDATTAVALIKQVAPLPSPNDPSPRRRRTVVCRYLRTAFGTLTVRDSAYITRGQTGSGQIPIRKQLQDLACTKRPGVGITAEYGIDVCLSSWSKTCPFAERE